jgi:hypothetical protein
MINIVIGQSMAAGELHLALKDYESQESNADRNILQSERILHACSFEFVSV